MAEEFKPTIVFDMDGVIHSYISGWQGIPNLPDPPVPGIKKAIDDIRNNGYRVVVHSTRCVSDEGKQAIEDYLKKYDIVVDEVSYNKPPALCYIDDRAITFDGHPETLLDKIQNFKTWYDLI